MHAQMFFKWFVAPCLFHSVLAFLTLTLACVLLILVGIPGTEDWPEEVLSIPEVEKMLQSFRWIRCSYTYFANPSHHFLHSLRAFG